MVNKIHQPINRSTDQPIQRAESPHTQEALCAFNCLFKIRLARAQLRCTKPYPPQWPHRTALSNPHERAVSPSAEIDTLCTAPMWPVRLARSPPVRTSHILVCVFVCESVYVCTCMYVCVVQENDWSKSIHNQKAMHVHTTCSRATDTGHTGPGNVNKYHPRKHLDWENVNEYTYAST